MSSIYVKQNKELAGVKLISASKAYVFNKTTGRKDKLNPNFEFVGKIDMSMPNLILKANKKDHKTSYVDDVSELPKRTKIEIVSYFFDEKGKRNAKEKAYLVRTDNKSKTSSELKRSFKNKNKAKKVKK